jgi:hypothetical protein
MRKRLFLPLLICLLPMLSASAQNLRLPRDPERLIDRVQKFWAAMASGQRFQALEFVLPEKKDIFVSGTVIPLLGAKVLGIDLTTDPNRATVRVAVDVFSPQAGANRASWPISDSWLWQKNNWYVNVETPPVFANGPLPGADAKAMNAKQEEIDKKFEILSNTIDVGRLIQGQISQVEVPIKYTGTVPVTVGLALPNPLVDIPVSAPLTSDSKNIVLVLSTENWEGPFNLPLVLNVQHEAATISRTLQVKGDVFAPITFRQDPPNGPIEEGKEFSVFIKNNTEQQVAIRFSVDAKLDFMKLPDVLPANSEIEAVLRLRPRESPDRLYLFLNSPVYGRETYVYRFRNAR